MKMRTLCWLMTIIFVLALMAPAAAMEPADSEAPAPAASATASNAPENTKIQSADGTDAPHTDMPRASAAVSASVDPLSGDAAITSDTTPDITPDPTPDTTPDTTPDPTPDTTPDATPDTTPDATPDATPNTTPDATPDVTPDATPDATPAPTPPGLWAVGLSEFDLPRPEAGGTVNLYIPAAFWVGGAIAAATNTRDGKLVRAIGGAGEAVPGSFDTYILEHVTYLKITLLSTGFTGIGGAGQSVVIVGTAERDNPWNLDEGTPYNLGFAAFENLPVSADGLSGRLTFEIEYQTRYAPRATERVDVPIAVLGPVITPTPTITPDPSATPQPNTDVRVGQMAVPRVRPGDTLTLAVPVRYSVTGERELQSNAAPDGETVVPYASGLSADQFDQAITEKVSFLRLELNQAQLITEGFPLEAGEFGSGRTIISGGANVGYAAFDGLTVAASAQNGTYPIVFDVAWQDASGREYATMITANLTVTGARTSSGGGGGGGGGGGASKPLPQAKLYVDSVKTVPERVRAGEAFDLILSIFNTNQQQDVANMSVTVTAEGDAFLPESGSNTAYIEKIGAGERYMLTLRMKASPDAPDKPVKIDVQMDYEDKSVSAQMAQQALIISIDPVFRVRMEDPIPKDMMGAMVNSPTVMVLQVVNEGKTMMYNAQVSVSAQGEDMAAGLSLPPSAFLGNMEAATSKNAELSIYPMSEGFFPLTFTLTYENARGEPFELQKTYDLYVSPEPTYEDYFPIETPPPVETGVDALEIARLMPWWLYAAFGGLIVLIVVFVGVSARGRRRKALEDDEME